MRQLLCATFVLAAFMIHAEDAAKSDFELPKPDSDGWIKMFNGKDLTGWDGDSKIWSVKDDYISGKTSERVPNTWLIFKHPFSNFVLEFEVMIIKGAAFSNSGVQYRSHVANKAKWVVHGYQADAGEGYWGDNYDEGGRALLWKGSSEARKTVKLYNEWNSYRVTADGSKLKHEVNGVLAGEMDDTNEKKRALSGIIALQYHDPGLNFEVRYRNVRIKILPDSK